MSTRFRIWLPPLLLVIAILLVLANFYQDGYLRLDWLAQHKDAIQAGSSLVTTTVAVTAAVVAYLRFFRGRVLAARADVVALVSVVAGPGDVQLHSLLIDFKNIGTIALLDPVVTVEAFARRGGADGDVEVHRLAESERLSAAAAKRYRLNVVDSGETSNFFVQHLFERAYWAVTYKVEIESPGVG